MSKYTQFFDSPEDEDHEVQDQAPVQAPDSGLQESAVIVPQETTVNMHGFENPSLQPDYEKNGNAVHVQEDKQNYDSPPIDISEDATQWDQPTVETAGTFQFQQGEKWQPSTKLQKARLKVKKFVEHLVVRLIGVVLVFFDISIVIVDIVINPPEGSTGMEVYDIISMIIWFYFFFEICLRIFAKGSAFFHSKLDLLDLSIVIITGAVTWTYVIADFSGDNSDIGKIINVCRFLRVFMFARLISERRHVTKASRKMVSENKRRYVKDGFDLDLTYVTDRVIASSFPSSGKQSIYRNPISEVSRFLNTKHLDHYKVFNLCSERHYDESYFNFQVERVQIDDHNVPKLEELIKFSKTAKQWMDADPDNILFIHCKGGKGRTGTAVCTWLLENGKFQTAKESLEYFGSRRTDLDVGNKFQGVQTPSQSRYVNYFEQVKYKYGGVIPQSKVLLLQHIRIKNLRGLGKGDGRDLYFEVICQNKKIFECRFENGLNCQTIYDHASDCLSIRASHCPELRGDVKIRFKSTSRKVPEDYDHCAFFFWFHTAFINDNRLSLPRDELDNPHKTKAHKIYDEGFCVEVRFTEQPESIA